MKVKRVKIIKSNRIRKGKYGDIKYILRSAVCPICYKDTILYDDGLFGNRCEHYAGRTEKFFIFVKGVQE